MTKSEYMARHGLTLRRVTSADVRAARTDYQREADYIITSRSGAEWYSRRGTMDDLRRAAGEAVG
jgi:hypothetical protein